MSDSESDVPPDPETVTGVEEIESEEEQEPEPEPAPPPPAESDDDFLYYHWNRSWFAAPILTPEQVKDPSIPGIVRFYGEKKGVKPVQLDDSKTLGLIHQGSEDAWGMVEHKIISRQQIVMRGRAREDDPTPAYAWGNNFEVTSDPKQDRKIFCATPKKTFKALRARYQEDVVINGSQEGKKMSTLLSTFGKPYQDNLRPLSATLNGFAKISNEMAPPSAAVKPPKADDKKGKGGKGGKKTAPAPAEDSDTEAPAPAPVTSWFQPQAAKDADSAPTSPVQEAGPPAPADLQPLRKKPAKSIPVREKAAPPPAAASAAAHAGPSSANGHPQGMKRRTVTKTETDEIHFTGASVDSFQVQVPAGKKPTHATVAVTYYYD